MNFVVCCGDSLAFSDKGHLDSVPLPVEEGRCLGKKGGHHVVEQPETYINLRL